MVAVNSTTVAICPEKLQGISADQLVLLKSETTSGIMSDFRDKHFPGDIGLTLASRTRACFAQGFQL